MRPSVIATNVRRFESPAPGLRLNTLLGLRWLAIAGQTAAVLVSALGLGLRFPTGACFLLIGASALLNLALRRKHPMSTQLSERDATILLGYDILQLAGLLFLTGGVANPFAVLFLAPVTIAAASLSMRPALGLLALAVVCATALARFSLPLPWIGGENLKLPPLYLFGLWAALAVSASFVGLYAWRVAQEARQTASALAAAELELARAQHLSQIDGLAAAAAHELGTPLATVSLVTRELAALPPPNEDFAEDLHLLEQSVERCRAILAKLSSPLDLAGRQMDISSPAELAEIAAAPYRSKEVAVTVEGEGGDPAPVCARNPGVISGLGALIENAVSFAENAVVIRAGWTKSTVTISIADDGPGFPSSILARAGEPYLSQRDGARRREKAGGGLGLGLFIARSLLERWRATLTFANAPPPAHGAVATVTWPREAYEQSRRIEQ